MIKTTAVSSARVSSPQASADYLALADKVAASIASGQMAVGSRLPPQRTFAFEHGIAVSTASRVYGELLRRGLVVGEVGRGTFVAGRGLETKISTELEQHETRIDLDYNFPVLPDQSVRITASLADLHHNGLDLALRMPTSAQLMDARATAASHLSHGRFRPGPNNIVLTAGGKQSIATTLSTLVAPGGRIAIEGVTYPSVKSLAKRLGIMLQPIPVDRDGLVVASLMKAHEAHPVSAVYVQPAMHNPLGVTLSQTRRVELADFAIAAGIPIIEDHVYGFLGDAEPLSVLAPEQCIVIDSLSKRVTSGLPLGFIVAPMSMRDRLAGTARSGAWAASGYGIAAGARLMADGTARGIETDKRMDAIARQTRAREILAGFELQGDPRSYHTWLQLPEPWRSESFTAIASRHGVAVTPASAFTVLPGHAPNAVRLAIGAPPFASLVDGLTRLRRLLEAGPDAFDDTE
jgi:DNA-binding transcriptional MocR family regulator